MFQLERILISIKLKASKIFIENYMNFFITRKDKCETMTQLKEKVWLRWNVICQSPTAKKVFGRGRVIF